MLLKTHSRWTIYLRLLLIGILIPQVYAKTIGDLEFRKIGHSEIQIYDCAVTANGVIVVPDKIDGYPVTSIGSGAFVECSDITSVILPESITKIGSSAFLRCSSLTSLVIPDRVETIEAATFKECSSLTSVILPEALLKIHQSCFLKCESLESITIPENVFSIRYSAFTECASLLKIKVNEANKTFSSLEGVLFNHNLTEILIFPRGRSGSYSIPMGVTKIGTGCFSTSRKISEIIIPSSVNHMVRNPFLNCESLSNINVDSESKIFASQNGVLFDPTLTELIVFPGGKHGIQTLPEGILKIGHDAFSSCSNLTEIILPDGLTSIGGFAFKSCKGLSKIEIPDTVTSLGRSIFSDCKGLIEVKLPSGASRIPQYAFGFCTKLKIVTLPPKLSEIGRYAFWGCIALEEIVFPETLKSIEDRAFTYCFKLTDVYFLGDAPTYGKRAITGRFHTHKIATIHYLSSRDGFTSPKWNGHDTLSSGEFKRTSNESSGLPWWVYGFIMLCMMNVAISAVKN